MPMNSSPRQLGIVRGVLYIVMGLALGTLALLADQTFGAIFAFGVTGLVVARLMFAPKREREKALQRLAGFDPTAGSPKISGVVVALVLLLFFCFLTYVAFKHYI